MRRRYFLFLVGSLSALVLVFFSSLAPASAHAACSISRIAYIQPPGGDADAEPVYIGHSHIASTPEHAKDQSRQFRLRGLHRNISVAGYSSSTLNTRPVDASSLTAPPRYTAPGSLDSQYGFLFRLTPF